MLFTLSLAAEHSEVFRGDCLLQHELCSHGLVGVEHNSDEGALSVRSDVSSERDTDSTSGSMGVDNLTPGASAPSVVLGVLHFVDIGNALTKIPFGAGLILAVFNMNQCLI